MTNRNFYWEYTQDIDSLIGDFCLEAKQKFPSAFRLREYEVQKSVQNVLWQMLQNSQYRTKYNELCNQGFPPEITCQHINKALSSLYPITCIDGVDSSQQPLLSPDLYEQFSYLKNHLVFYCKNERLFQYMLPVINAIPEPIIVMTVNSLPDYCITNPSITFLSLSDFQISPYVSNSYLQQTFPQVFQYANALSIFIELLVPKAIFLIEGPHFESAIIGEICRHKQIPTVCIQQGWPGILHTAFRNMNYDYYLTWGEAFNDLWGKYNSYSHFINVGYVYSLAPSHTKKYVTFFLQAPIILLDQDNYSGILYFIEYIADNFPDQKIYIREHPEYRLPNYYHPYYARYPNIFWGTELPLEDIYSETLIGIAAYSSTLSEGILHDVIPFSFLPGSSFHYYPNLEQIGVGMCASTLQEAQEKIHSLLTDNTKTKDCYENIRLLKSHYFTAYGTETIRNIMDFLQNIKIT